jgi:hypothetical protein
MQRVRYRFLFLILAFVFAASGLPGQGCSDAGFCTVSSLKLYREGMKDPERPNRIKVGFLHGQADHGISVFGSYLEYTRRGGACRSQRQTVLSRPGWSASNLRGTFRPDSQRKYPYCIRAPASPPV